MRKDAKNRRTRAKLAHGLARAPDAPNAAIIEADAHQEQDDENYDPSIVRMATIGQQGLKDPLTLIGNAIAAALDPYKTAGPCKTLQTMTPEDQAKMVALYGPISTQPRLDVRCNSFCHRGRKAPLATSLCYLPYLT